MREHNSEEVVGEDLAGQDVVGRRAELAMLDRRFQEARAGRPQLVFVQGPAGIGKSSLVRAFLRQDDCAAGTVLHAACREMTAGSPFNAVRDLLGPLDLAPESTEDSGYAHSGARWAAPALAPSTGRSGADHEPPTYAVLQGLYWLAASLMSEGPAVLALDDAHWCDEHSLSWLEFLLRRAEGMPLLVVLAQRTLIDDAPVGVSLPESLTPISTTLDLGPLDESEITTVITRKLAQAPTGRFTHSCADASGGNPLALDRLLGALRQSGVRPDDAGVDSVAEVNRDVVASSVMSYLTREPEHVQQVAKVIAVLGPTDADLVAGVAEAPLEQVQTAIDALRRNDILADGELDFVHDVVRSAVLDEIPDQELHPLRARVARLLGDAGRPAEEAAAQILQLPSADRPWMREVLRDAAHDASRRGAPGATARYLTAVVDADPGAIPVRVELARKLAQTDPAAAVPHLEFALEQVTDPRARAPIAAQFATVALSVQNSPEAVRVVTGALDDLIAEIGPRPGAADRELRTMVEAVLLVCGSDEKSTIAAIRGRFRAMVRPDGKTPAERQMLSMMSAHSAMEGNSAEAVVAQARSARLGNEIESTGWQVLLVNSLVLYLADEADDALVTLAQLLAHNQEHGSAWGYALALSTRATVLLALGNIGEASADAQLAMEIAEQGAYLQNVTMPQSALATTLALRGEPERAERILDQVTRPRMEDFVWEYHFYLMARAQVRFELGDHEGALEHLFRCGRSLEEAHITNPVMVPWWAEATCLLAELDRGDEAVGLVEHGERMAQRWGTARGLGLARLARGVITPGERGIELMAEAVDHLAESPARWEHAKASLVLGRALLRAEQVGAARKHLRRAADLAMRCGCLALGASARDLLVEAGGRMRRITDSGMEGLTGSERRVATLAATGVSNREIAESLFVTVRTVELHLTSAYRRLGISGRAALPAVLEGGSLPSSATAGISGSSATAGVSASSGQPG